MGTLRLFLATVVMLGHYDVLEVSLATIAVCCFYIISGFYMQLLLFPPKVNVANFYISRALRIYPLYWALTAVTFLVQAPSELWGIAGHYFIKFIYVLNTLTLFGHDALTLVQYDPQTAHFASLFSFGTPKPGSWIGYNLTVLGQAWSLSVELLFYAMAPLLLKLRTRWLCLTLLCSLSIKLYIASFGVFDTFWIDAFYPAELLFFLSGAVAFRVYQNLNGQGSWSLASSKAVSTLTLLAFAAATFRYGKDTDLITSHWFTIYFCVTGVTVLILPFVFHASRSSSLDRWVGNLSYPIYLSHLAMMQIMTGLMHVHNVVSIVFMTVATSVAGYCLIDKPVDKLRHIMFPIRQAASGSTKVTMAQSERLPKPVVALGAALHGVEMIVDKGWSEHDTERKHDEDREIPVKAGSPATRRVTRG